MNSSFFPILCIFGVLVSLSAAALPVDSTFTTDRIDLGSGKTKIKSDSAGRLFVTEKQGRVLLYQPDGSGAFQTPPLVMLDIISLVDPSAESGLLGFALDPDFDTNRHVYLFYTTTTDQRLVRYTANAGLTSLESPTVLLSGLPRAVPIHNAGDIGFHPLDPTHLFIALGDDDNRTRPQDLDFYEGKILRISKTNGEGVATNPFYDGDPTSVRSRVWAQGFRNPFRFTFHPTRADVLFVSENGDSTDRLAWVQRGSNGNWGPSGDTAFLAPTDPNFRILFSGPASQVGVVVATSGPFAWNDEPTLYLSHWHPNGSILRFALSGADLDTATPIPDGSGSNYWENGAIAVGFELATDGHLYFTSTNGNASPDGWYGLSRYRKIASDPPTSAFSTSVTNAQINTDITFTSNSTAGTAAIVNHLWDFGDGSQSSAMNPVHNWTAPGSYSVSLTVTDAENLSHVSTESITITEPSSLDLDVIALDTETGVAPVDSLVLVLRQSNGDLISAHPFDESGRLVENILYDSTGASVIVEISGGGFQPLIYEITGTSLTRTFHLSETAISGSVSTFSGDPIVVDLGLFSSGNPTAFAGGRDYLSAFPPTGQNHRVTTDEFGRFYFPLSNTNRDYTIIAAEDTNAGLYAKSQVEVAVSANELTAQGIVLGQWDGGEGRDDLSGISVTPEVSYEAIQTIFTNNCTGCHRASSENSGGLDLTAAHSLVSLLDQPSNFVPGLTLVEPSNPARSYLFEKINRAIPQQGARMRPSDSMSLSDQALIRDWITQLSPTPPTIEFTFGELEGLTAGAIGILVADRDENGFTSLTDPSTLNTPLVAGELIRGSDDVIVATMQADDSGRWNGGVGFENAIAEIDYERLDIETGDPLVFYWFPTLAGESASLGVDLEYFSFRSEDVGASGGTMAFAVPENEGIHRLSFLSTTLGGHVDSSNLGASGIVEQGQTPNPSIPEVDRDLLTPDDFSAAPSETDAAYDSVHAGNYIGLLRRDAAGADEADIAGIASGKITHNRKTENGTVSFRILYERMKYGVRGSIAEDGGFVATFTKKDLAETRMTVSGQLADTPEGRKVVGTITGDGETTRLNIFQRTFHARKNPASQAGRYTLALPFDETADHSVQPGGDGIGYGKLNRSGVMRAGLVLGEGTKSTAVFYLNADGEMIFYRSLYKRSASGWIAGNVSFREVENISAADGLVHWKKGASDLEPLYPSGFDIEQQIVAARFEIPNPRAGRRVLSELPDDDENAILNFAGGNTSAISGKFLKWDRRNRIQPSSSTEEEPLSLKISPKTGLVSGRYRNNTAGQDLRFVGIAIQNQGLVVGNFKGIGQSGSIVIDSSGHPAINIERVSDGGAIADGDSLNFENVGVDGGMTEIGIRVKNTGTGTLILNGRPTLSQDGAGFLLSATSSGPIRPGGERQIRVLFDPSMIGNENGAIVIRSNDESHSPFVINLLGNGAAGSDGAGRENSGSDHLNTPREFITSIETTGSDYDPTVDPGSYLGLISWDHAGSIPAGQIVAKMSNSTSTDTGSVTGSLIADGSRLKFRGTLSPSGIFSGTLSGTTSSDFVLTLSAGETTSGEQALSGRLRNIVTGEEFSVVAIKSGWSRALQSPYAGRYTILLPAKGNLGQGYPGGDGAGAVTASTSGTIKLLTYLADGKRLAWSGRVDDSGKIHIYRHLDKLKPSPSLISGILSFRDIPNISDFDGELHWRRSPDSKSSIFPEGFEISQEAIGSVYNSPTANEFVLPELSDVLNNSELTLTGHTLSEAFDLDWTVSNRGSYSPLTTERIGNKINSKSGFFAGSWWDRGNTGTKVRYRGVAFQKQALVSGYWYFLDGQTGLMQVRPK